MSTSYRGQRQPPQQQHHMDSDDDDMLALPRKSQQQHQSQSQPQRHHNPASQQHGPEYHDEDEDQHHMANFREMLQSNEELQERLHSLAEQFQAALATANDIAASFNIDISSHLDEYTEHAGRVKIRFNNKDDDAQDDAQGLSHTSINFAEASQILESSARLYTKKVDHLHAVIARLLNDISAQDAQEENRRRAAAGVGNPNDKSARGKAAANAAKAGAELNPFAYEDPGSLLLRPLHIDPFIKHDQRTAALQKQRLEQQQQQQNQGQGGNVNGLFDDDEWDFVGDGDGGVNNKNPTLLTSIYDGEHPRYKEARVETLNIDPPVSLLSTEPTILQVAKTIPSNGYHLTSLPIHSNGTFLLQTTNTYADPTHSTGAGGGGRFGLGIESNTDDNNNDVSNNNDIAHPFARMQWLAETNIPQQSHAFNLSSVYGAEILHIPGSDNLEVNTLASFLRCNQLSTLLDSDEALDSMFNTTTTGNTTLTTTFNAHNSTLTGPNGNAANNNNGDDGNFFDQSFFGNNNTQNTQNTMGDMMDDYTQQQQQQQNTQSGMDASFLLMNNEQQQGVGGDDDQLNEHALDFLVLGDMAEQNDTGVAAGSGADGDMGGGIPNEGIDGAGELKLDEHGNVILNDSQFAAVLDAAGGNVIPEHVLDDSVIIAPDDDEQDEDDEDGENNNNQQPIIPKQPRQPALPKRARDVLLRQQALESAKDTDKIALYYSYHNPTVNSHLTTHTTSNNNNKIKQNKINTLSHGMLRHGKLHFTAQKIRIPAKTTYELISQRTLQSPFLQSFPQQSYYLYRTKFDDLTYKQKVASTTATSTAGKGGGSGGKNNMNTTIGDLFLDSHHLNNNNNKSTQQQQQQLGQIGDLFKHPPQLIINLLSESAIGCHSDDSWLKRNRQVENDLFSCPYNHLLERPEHRLFGVEYYLQSTQRQLFLNEIAAEKVKTEEDNIELEKLLNKTKSKQQDKNKQNGNNNNNTTGLPFNDMAQPNYISPDIAYLLDIHKQNKAQQQQHEDDDDDDDDDENENGDDGDEQKNVDEFGNPTDTATGRVKKAQRDVQLQHLQTEAYDISLFTQQQQSQQPQQQQLVKPVDPTGVSGGSSNVNGATATSIKDMIAALAEQQQQQQDGHDDENDQMMMMMNDTDMMGDYTGSDTHQQQQHDGQLDVSFLDLSQQQHHQQQQNKQMNGLLHDTSYLNDIIGTGDGNNESDVFMTFDATHQIDTAQQTSAYLGVSTTNNTAHEDMLAILRTSGIIDPTQEDIDNYTSNNNNFPSSSNNNNNNANFFTNQLFGNTKASTASSHLAATQFQTACASHIQQYIQLSKRFEPQREQDQLLAAWEAKMDKVLNSAETHRGFDAVEYGHEVITKATQAVAIKTQNGNPQQQQNQQQQQPLDKQETQLNTLFQNEPAGEVCRIFLASLFLANQRNVEFSEPKQKDWEHFDGSNINIKVLNANIIRGEFDELSTLEQSAKARGADAAEAVTVETGRKGAKGKAAAAEKKTPAKRGGAAATRGRGGGAKKRGSAGGGRKGKKRGEDDDDEVDLDFVVGSTSDDDLITLTSGSDDSDSDSSDDDSDSSTDSSSSDDSDDSSDDDRRSKKKKKPTQPKFTIESKARKRPRGRGVVDSDESD